jgi:NDP-sugar pyrophosphorylase family protein
MSDLTLVVLAAGVGSRYGGLKQLDGVGPGGEIIMDYSVYDALRAGFKRLVFVIRPDFEAAFRAQVSARYEARAEVRYVHQELRTGLPAAFRPPAARTKPWGTGHALMVCHQVVDGPFCVINADDFYGAQAFRVMGDFLTATAGGQAAMVGYPVGNTLSAHGSVCRGVCQVSNGRLQSVVERTEITPRNNGIEYRDDSGWHRLTGRELVSMNFWGFLPAIFPHLLAQFEEFLASSGTELKSEFFIPTVVDRLVREGRLVVRVLESSDRWFGITYPQDKALVQNSLRDLAASGAYPQRLWN